MSAPDYFSEFKSQTFNVRPFPRTEIDRRQAGVTQALSRCARLPYPEGITRCTGTFFRGGTYRAESLPSLSDEVERFHSILHDLSNHLERGDALLNVTPEQLLQGPLADVMTHAGQLAMLRRLHGSAVPPENFIEAEIDPSRLGEDQVLPRAPDVVWPEQL